MMRMSPIHRTLCGVAKSQAIEFVQYGYTGVLPADSTGLDTIPSGQTINRDKFEWRWWPVKP
jgi:hypothetical protein